jgi:hypothetical protein
MILLAYAGEVRMDGPAARYAPATVGLWFDDDNEFWQLVHLLRGETPPQPPPSAGSSGVGVAG